MCGFFCLLGIKHIHYKYTVHCSPSCKVQKCRSISTVSRDLTIPCNSVTVTGLCYQSWRGAQIEPGTTAPMRSLSYSGNLKRCKIHVFWPAEASPGLFSSYEYRMKKLLLIIFLYKKVKLLNFFVKRKYFINHYFFLQKLYKSLLLVKKNY